MKVELICDRCYKKQLFNTDYIKAITKIGDKDTYKIWLDKPKKTKNPNYGMSGGHVLCKCIGNKDWYSYNSIFRISKEDKVKLMAVLV